MGLDKEMGALFREEVNETLGELDNALLELEKNPGDLDLVNRVFRAVHTLKGACDMFGVDPVVALAHEMESVFDMVRNGRLDADKPLLDVAFAAKDRVTAMLREGADPRAVDATDLIAAFRSMASPPAPEVEPEPEPQADAEPEAARKTFRVVYAPSDPGHLAKTDPLELLDQLRALGECDLTADFSGLPELEALDPTDCVLRFTALVTTNQDANAIRDVFFFLENQEDLRVEPVEAETNPEAGTALAPSREPAVAPETVQAPASAPERPEATVAVAPAVKATATPVPAAAPGQAAAPQRAARPQTKTESVQSLRVDAAKLDELVNLVGELVIAQARLTQLAGKINHAALTGVAEEIERLSNELRDNTLGIRMLPIGTTFGRFRRLVRDLSSDMNKQIELVTEGGETELDKTVIEQLNDPLVHLLRNSIDHGVESPRERMEQGKPPQGRIRLSAQHAGGEVLIHIVDDGKGLDPAKIRAKALEKGLVPPEAKLSDQEIFNLIFLPGFSTAEKVTNISGRGVGMDVVKRSIDGLRGKIDINSAPGKGTDITIKLPLTLAIIDGLQVQTGEDHYIIPLAMVEECVELLAEEAAAAGRSRTIHLRGEIVPYVRLREAFEIEGRPPAIEQIVITRHEDNRTGIAVDEVIGQQQTVIKSLGAYIGNVEGISGATINGDGTMSLILDVPTLVQAAKRAAA